jgi:hypothetical protein
MSNRDVHFTRDAAVLAAVRVLADQFPDQPATPAQVLDAAGAVADAYEKCEENVSLAEFTAEAFRTWLRW